MKRLFHIVSIMIVLQMSLSCRAISSFLTNDKVVAEVGMNRLYRSDLDKIIPKGLSQEDSSRMARQYINTWASDLVYLEIAEEQLSKSEKDVSKELEDYRKSLLKYRYEQLYINERLDTSVHDDAIEEYYQTHKDKFILARPIVKARYLNILGDSPMYDQIRRKMSSDITEDVVEADSLAYSSAMKFMTWSDKWIDIAVLAREFSGNYEQLLLKKDKNGWIEEQDTTGVVRVAFLSDMMQIGEFAPIEYVKPVIKDMIISSRKQSMISNLERDLLNEARENGQFVIY